MNRFQEFVLAELAALGRMFGRQAQGLVRIEASLATIIQLLRSRPTKIALELPAIKSTKGKSMPNFELKSDTVATITIKTTTASGAVEPIPSGDVFSVASSSLSLGATIGVDGSGNPAIVLTPAVQASPGITVTVTDSAGLAAATLIVDVVEDVTDTNIVLDVADAVLTSQPTPTAPGP